MTMGPKSIRGGDLVKQVANATNKVAGDGCKSVAAGSNVMDLLSGINKAVEAVIANLKSRAVKISTPGEITQVATISANGEQEIGEAMEKVGKDGTITIMDGHSVEDELDMVE